MITICHCKLAVLTTWCMPKVVSCSFIPEVLDKHVHFRRNPQPQSSILCSTVIIRLVIKTICRDSSWHVYLVHICLRREAGPDHFEWPVAIKGMKVYWPELWNLTWKFMDLNLIWNAVVVANFPQVCTFHLNLTQLNFDMQLIVIPKGMYTIWTELWTSVVIPIILARFLTGCFRQSYHTTQEYQLCR